MAGREGGLRHGFLKRRGIRLYETSGELAETLHPEESAYIHRAVPKRRDEFRTVRALARRGLEDLGLPRPPMVPGQMGEPHWPHGVIGSITHCQGYRAVALGRKGAVYGVGIDGEPNRSLPQGVLAHIASPMEREVAGRLAAMHPSIAGDTLLFSAKEALYKAWFPMEGTFLTFDDAQVFLHDDGLFTAQIHPSVPRHGRRLTVPARLMGRWELSGTILCTAVLVSSHEGLT